MAATVRTKGKKIRNRVAILSKADARKCLNVGTREKRKGQIIYRTIIDDWQSSKQPEGSRTKDSFS